MIFLLDHIEKHINVIIFNYSLYRYLPFKCYANLSHCRANNCETIMCDVASIYLKFDDHIGEFFIFHMKNREE